MYVCNLGFPKFVLSVRVAVCSRGTSSVNRPRSAAAKRSRCNKIYTLSALSPRYITSYVITLLSPTDGYMLRRDDRIGGGGRDDHGRRITFVKINYISRNFTRLYTSILSMYYEDIKCFYLILSARVGKHSRNGRWQHQHAGEGSSAF